jgi:hypothetical protein
MRERHYHIGNDKPTSTTGRHACRIPGSSRSSAAGRIAHRAVRALDVCAGRVPGLPLLLYEASFRLTPAPFWGRVGARRPRSP